MKTIDLTHTISPSMPVYPGTLPPGVVDGCTISKDGFAEKKLTFFTHTGTHLDAPAHLLKGAKTLDSYPAGHFVGRAVVADLAKTGSGNAIERADFMQLEPLLPSLDFLLIKTGWSRFWGDERYFDNFPTLSENTANWLNGFNLKGVGIDAISFDPVGSSTLPVHKLLLGRGLILIENLTNLELLPLEPFLFSCLPLKIGDADGSPVRAVALIG